MNILISNDDGIMADGIVNLAKKLSERHNVLVVAPDGERSANSHKLSIRTPLKLKKYMASERLEAYMFSGTPADCIKYAVNCREDFKIDAVIGGINKGSNVGHDIMYSGTCAIAREAACSKLPAISLSLDHGENFDYDFAVSFVCDKLDKLVSLCGEGYFINVNFPNIIRERIKGVKVCKVGELKYENLFKIDENGDYLIQGALVGGNGILDNDVEFLANGYITVTPINVVSTNFEVLDKIKEKLSL